MRSSPRLRRVLGATLPALVLLGLAALALPASASANIVIRQNGSRWAEIEDDGDVYIQGSRAGEIDADGVVYRNGSRIGEITSGGVLYRNGSRVAEVTSDGTLYVNGSRVGEIEGDGDIYKNGSRWGEADSCCSGQQLRWVAAVLVLFESGFI